MAADGLSPGVLLQMNIPMIFRSERMILLAGSLSMTTHSRCRPTAFHAERYDRGPWSDAMAITTTMTDIRMIWNASFI